MVNHFSGPMSLLHKKLLWQKYTSMYQEFYINLSISQVKMIQPKAKLKKEKDRQCAIMLC